ncbi:MAG: hypothetical protein GYA24_05615 [Candidatus Lokiarchaeota archaeon]|nr:hypothetical protein [Candidatus Lokiarchaeota archaeon]
MMFITDTCFWMHVRELFTELGIDLRPLLCKVRWGVTEQVKKEIEARRATSFFPETEGFLIPVSDDELDAFQKRTPTISQFDEADQTLILVAVRDHGIVLTDDGAVYIECQCMGVDVMMLPQLCIGLAKDGQLDKNDVYKMLRSWDENGRFAKKFIKELKADLQTIRGVKP